MPSKIIRLIKTNENTNESTVAHTIELYVETGPAPRPATSEKKEVNGKIGDYLIHPKETGTSCAQYKQKLEFDEWPDRDLQVFVDYGSYKKPIDRLRFYVDDCDIETREHIDVKDNCSYRCTKIFVWFILICLACGIGAIIQVTSGSIPAGVITALVLALCLVSWLWNCWCCCKSWNYAELDLNIDGFEGHRQRTNGKQNNIQTDNDYDDDIR